MKTCVLTCLFSVSLCFSQDYPLWFIRQGDLPCAKTVVGYVHASSYRDSAAAYALRQAETTYQRQALMKISGSQSFWATEAGTFWMGSDVKEEYDTAAHAALVPIDTVTVHGLVLVLASPTGCDAAQARGVISLKGRTAPGWTETLPRDAMNHYAVGVAPEYFYEKSSWDEAERLARRNLARTVCSTMKSLQKASLTEAQDIRYEELSVLLQDYHVRERWFDAGKKLFYVLVSMQRD
ncbi:MAG: hypothetical protein HY961_04660 [Ignavibacteriae bacterium]|nr:hypothetical protein [Ignavibacteriota bacterium]